MTRAATSCAGNAPPYRPALAEATGLPLEECQMMGLFPHDDRDDHDESLKDSV